MSQETAQTDARSDTQVFIIGAGPVFRRERTPPSRCKGGDRGTKGRAAHHETRGTAAQPAILEVLDKGRVVARFSRAACASGN